MRGVKGKAGLNSIQIASFAGELCTINGTLWNIEDAIREAESHGEFRSRFIELARGVYLTNGYRALG